MKLLDFYVKAIKSIGLTLDDDNFICLEENGKLERVMHNKKQILLPTPENLRHINDNIIIFNPLEEDSIRGINPSMIKYKAAIDRRLAQSFNVISELVSVLGENLDIQKKATLELNKFLSSLSVLRKQNMKNNIVDEAFVNLVRKIVNTSLTKSAHSGSIFIKTDKGKVLDGEKFNKVASLALPIYEDLKENSESIFDIELKRKKDAGIYSIITEFIIGTKDDNTIDYEKYNVGSNHLESPTFIVVYKLYYKLAKRFNALLKSLSFVNKEIAEAAMINLELELDDLLEITNFAGELKLIPNLNTGSKKEDTRVAIAPNLKPLPTAGLRPFVDVNKPAERKPMGAGALLRSSSEERERYVEPAILVSDRPRMPLPNDNRRVVLNGRPTVPMDRPRMPLVARETQPRYNREYQPFSRHGGFGY